MTQDRDKTKAQLLAELKALRARLSDESESEGRRTEEALRRSAHELRESQRVGRLGTYVFDAATGTWTSSEIMDQVFGLTDLDYARDVHGWLQLVHPDDREDMRAYLEGHVLTEGRDFDREYRIVRADDGQERWVHGLGELVLDEDGRVARMFGTIQDVTERKRVEKELRASVEWQEAIIEGSRDAIFVSDTSSMFVRVNSAACEFTGYAREELLGMSIPDLHEDVDLQAYRAYHASILAGHEAMTEAAIRRKDGTKVWAEFNNRRMEVAGVSYMHTVARDVTAWKDAQEALRHKEVIVAGSTDMLALLDRDYTCLSANTALATALGGTVDDVAGRPATEIFGVELFTDVIRPFARCALAGETLQCRRWFDFPGSRRVHLDVTYSPYRGPDEQVLGFVFNGRDTTERRRAEEALLDSRESLRNLAARLDSVREEERTAIARELHDEVGQALTAMRMDLSLMETDGAGNREARTDRLRSLIDVTEGAILRVNRMSEELRSPVLGILGLQAAVETQVEEFIERSGMEVDLELHIDELVESSDRDLVAFRLLQESLSNVWQHARADRVDVQVRLRGEGVELEVLDDGIGITDEQLKNHRSFGLIGMRERVERVRGRIEIGRRPEGGTRVWAEIPAYRPEAPADSPSPLEALDV